MIANEVKVASVKMKTVENSSERFPSISGKFHCSTCHVVMSRRSIKKPHYETGLIEVTYRCPTCGGATSRWIGQ
jgi:Zn finger protein HypA/HybF involved in hydrogenase expression